MAKTMARSRHIRLSAKLDDAITERAQLMGVPDSYILRAAIESFLASSPVSDGPSIERILAKQTFFVSLVVDALASKANIKTDEFLQVATEEVSNLFAPK